MSPSSLAPLLPTVTALAHRCKTELDPYQFGTGPGPNQDVFNYHIIAILGGAVAGIVALFFGVRCTEGTLDSEAKSCSWLATCYRKGA